MSAYKQTELDEQLRELALTDWPKFVRLVGEKSISKAKVCLLKKLDRTHRYISYRTRLKKSTVGNVCKTCPE